MSVLAFIRIKGEKQGLITQSASSLNSIGNRWQEGKEDWSLVLSVDHMMEVKQSDSESLSPQRTHHPIKILKLIDKSSPLLATAMSTGERLPECQVDLFRYTDTGSLENFYTITLRGARVVRIQSNMSSSDISLSGAIGSEWISFSYNRIEWRHQVAGTYGVDGWDDSVYSLNSPVKPSPQPESKSKKASSSTVSGGNNNSTGENTVSPEEKMWANSRFMMDGNVATGSLEQSISVRMESDIEYLAFLTLPEAREFLDNLWNKTHAKDVITKGSYINAATKSVKDVHDIAKGLGGLGVVAYTKTYKGQDYIILKNFKKELKTLLAGTRYRADNPKVLKLGLGKKSGLNELKIGFRGMILFAAAVEFVDYAMSDKQTWVDLAGNIGSDIVKGVISTSVGVEFGEMLVAFAASAIAAPVAAGVFATGTIVALSVFLLSLTLDSIDSHLKLTDKVITTMKKEVEKL